MTTKVHNNPEHTNHRFFHRGLVKFLVLEELKKYDRTWSHFIFWSGLQLEQTMDPNDKGNMIDKRGKILRS